MGVNDTTAKFKPPLGACDSHIHVYGDPAQFPSLPVHGRELNRISSKTMSPCAMRLALAER